MSALASRYNLSIIINEQKRGNAIRNMTKELHLANAKIEQLEKRLGIAGKKSKTLKDRMRGLATTMKNVLVPAIVLGIGALTKFLTEGVADFAKYDQKIHETFTLLPQTSAEMREQMTTDLRIVGLEFGRMTDDTIPALYQALSARIDPENAVEAVAIAARAATAGASDMASTMKVGAAVVNAYGSEIYDLEDAYDIMFQLIRDGVPTMQDWGASLQDVISVASESGTKFEDVAAALAIMTQQGDSSAEAAELLGFVLMQLGLSGTSAAKAWAAANGKSYRESIAQGESLVVGLQKMQIAADETGVALIDMVGGDSKFYRDMQAARGLAEITGIHLGDMVEQTERMDDVSGGMNEAFTEAADNMQFKIDKMNAAWEDMKIHIGGAIANTGILEAAIEGVVGISQILSGIWVDMLPDSADMLSGIDSIDLARQSLKDWKKEELFFTGTNQKDKWNEELMNRVKVLAQLTDSYGEFRDVLFETNVARQYTGALGEPNAFADTSYANENQLVQRLGLQASWLKKEFRETYAFGEGDMIGDDDEIVYIGRQQKMAAAYWLAVKAEQEQVKWLEIEDELYGRIYRSGIQNIGMRAKEAAAINEVATNMKLFDAWYQKLEVRRGMPAMDAAIDNMLNLSVWKNVDPGTFQEGVLEAGQSIGDLYGTIFEEVGNLSENAGEWHNVLLDNTREITEVTQDLNADLQGDQREHWENVMDEVEEGSSAWLHAYEMLQGDLTDTQRDELIKRKADLTEEQDGVRSIWEGDAEAAEESQLRIEEAMKGIVTSYGNMIDNLLIEAVAERYEGIDSTEAQKVLIDFQVAKGDMLLAEGELRKTSFERADAVTTIWNEMTTAYSDDLGFDHSEIEALATAAEVLETELGEHDVVALRKLVDEALGKAGQGGFPAIAHGILKDSEDGPVYALGLFQDEIVETTNEGDPYDVLFAVEDTAFVAGMKIINQAITDAVQSTNKITFTAVYKDNGPPPGFGGGSSTTEADNASGVLNSLVPPGYPNDSYLVGLTSGETYSVWNNSQKAGRQGPGNGTTIIDRSKTDIQINNHTRAAAELAESQIQILQKARTNSLMSRR